MHTVILTIITFVMIVEITQSCIIALMIFVSINPQENIIWKFIKEPSINCRNCCSNSEIVHFCFNFSISVSHWKFILGSSIRTCVDCSKVYKSLQSYHNHIRYDCGNKIVNYQCPIMDCLYATKRRYDLKRHQKTVHRHIDFKHYIC